MNWGRKVTNALGHSCSEHRHRRICCYVLFLFKDASDSARARQSLKGFSGCFRVYLDTPLFCYPAFFDRHCGFVRSPFISLVTLGI